MRLIRWIGVPDKFGQSGSTHELYKKYGLDSEGIKNTVQRKCIF